MFLSHFHGLFRHRPFNPFKAHHVTPFALQVTGSSTKVTSKSEEIRAKEVLPSPSSSIHRPSRATIGTRPQMGRRQGRSLQPHGCGHRNGWARDEIGDMGTPCSFGSANFGPKALSARSMEYYGIFTSMTGIIQPSNTPGKP